MKSTKSKNPTMVNCPVCGKLLSKRGLAGHMQWKHKKQPGAPMLPSKVKPLVTQLKDQVAMLEALLKSSFIGKALVSPEGKVLGYFKRAEGDAVADLYDTQGNRVGTLEATESELQGEARKLFK